MGQTGHKEMPGTAVSNSPDAVEQISKSSATTDLFLASFLALFMEVMLIRWVPSYERILAHFTNFVLRLRSSAWRLLWSKWVSCLA